MTTNPISGASHRAAASGAKPDSVEDTIKKMFDDFVKDYIVGFVVDRQIVANVKPAFLSEDGDIIDDDD
jgi:hypothetical protein